VGTTRGTARPRSSRAGATSATSPPSSSASSWTSRSARASPPRACGSSRRRSAGTAPCAGWKRSSADADAPDRGRPVRALRRRPRRARLDDRRPRVRRPRPPHRGPLPRVRLPLPAAARPRRAPRRVLPRSLPPPSGAVAARAVHGAAGARPRRALGARDGPRLRAAPRRARRAPHAAPGAAPPAAPQVQLAAVVRRMLEGLAAEGLVIVEVPNAGGLGARLFGRAWSGLELPRHLSHFTPETLERTVRKAGGRVVWCWHQAKPRYYLWSLSHVLRDRGWDSLVRVVESRPVYGA